MPLLHLQFASPGCELTSCSKIYRCIHVYMDLSSELLAPNSACKSNATHLIELLDFTSLPYLLPLQPFLTLVM